MRGRASVGILIVGLLVAVTAWARIVPGQRRAGELRRATKRPKATGFFHTQQLDGKWWIVTPDGRLFYSHGVNHVTADPDTDRTTGRCPYCEAVAAKYPDVEAWSDKTIARLRRWGFNTIGAWSDYDLLGDRMPYTYLLSMAGGDDWFAPEFEQRAAEIAAERVAPRRDDPNLLGWLLDNELRWGKDFRRPEPVLTDYLELPPGSPGRIVADRFVGDPSGFLRELATRYYQVTTSAIRAVDPNHMILGNRFISFLTPVEVVEVAGQWIDVLSANNYTLVPGFAAGLNGLWGPFIEADATLSEFHARSGRPVMITEYSFRGADAGLPNSWPPIYLTFPTQAERADAHAQFVRQLYESPWVVGDHWFEYVDQPPGGRFDGEDNNFGVVSNGDDPYEPFTDSLTRVHATAPDRLVRPRARCGAWERRKSSRRIRCTHRLRVRPRTS